MYLESPGFESNSLGGGLHSSSSVSPVRSHENIFKGHSCFILSSCQFDSNMEYANAHRKKTAIEVIYVKRDENKR
jgi:hypothetical protein